ncbi:MAG TPA: GAF domain-containing protein [Drouetiella sp.]
MHIEPDKSISDDQTSSSDASAKPDTLNEALAELVLTLEHKSERPLFGSILLVDESGKRLHRGAAPSLPETYSRQIDGIEIGPNAGSCGTAVFCGHPIYVVDIETDALWRDFKHMALSHGLRSCWSMPIIGSKNNILGTFAVYYKMARSANDSERLIMTEGAKEAARLIESFRGF